MCPRCLSEENKTYKRLDDTMIHQFRMYIDKHNIEYVRNNFDGKTDYEKLKIMRRSLSSLCIMENPPDITIKFKKTVHLTDKSTIKF